jgi:putative transposase
MNNHGLSIVTPTRQGTTRRETPAPALPPSEGISAKGKQIALARFQLLRAWKAVRGSNGSITKATDNFLRAYNAGISHPAIFEVLGNVTRGTLYRWDETIEDGSDWQMLVPQYHLSKNHTERLNPIEAEVFMRFLLLPNKVRIGTATRLTKYTLEQRGYKTDKSAMTFRRFAEDYINTHYDTWILMREGQKALKDKVAPYIKRDPALLEVGDAVVADGHRLNFRVVNPFTGRPCRATLVIGIDWKSFHPAGYEIMVEENTQCIAAAQRNSIINIGKVMKVWYTDNGKAFRSRFFAGSPNLEESGLYGLSARLGVIHIFAMPYNARAKIVERWFKEFSNTFERLLPSYIGASIGDKPAYMMRNEKFHRALHNEYVPTIEEAVQLIEMWFDFHRSQECPHVKGKTIGEVFDAGKGPGVNVAELDDLMMDVKITNIRRNGIHFLNADYYDDNLYGLREEVTVRYSLFDLSEVKVYTVKGEFICRAKRVMPVHPLARVLGTPKDVTELSAEISRQRRLERQTVEGAKELAGLGKIAQLDWQRIVEVAPGIVEKLERADVTLPALEEHIPEECFPDTRETGKHTGIAPTTQEIPRLEPQTRPIFETATERYEWHLKFGMFTDEDRAWCNWFMTTHDFKMLYTYFDKQRKEAIDAGV